MRHRVERLQFNRFSSWRSATLRSLVRSLLIFQSIKTTKTKARAAKAMADSLISLARKDTLAARREAFRVLGEHRLVNLLFEDIAKRFSGNSGGYTRLLNLGMRRGDSAPVAILELLEIKRKEKKATKKEKEPKAEEAVERPKVQETKPAEEKKTAVEKAVKEKEREKQPPVPKKEPSKKFLGGLRNIFKKERDSL